MKNFKELERMVKGFSNHRRIEILSLLKKKPELSIDEVSEILNVNYKTISEHVRRLAAAGLVKKWHEGAAVRHALTRRGVDVLMFLRTLE